MAHLCFEIGHDKYFSHHFNFRQFSSILAKNDVYSFFLVGAPYFLKVISRVEFIFNTFTACKRRYSIKLREFQSKNGSRHVENHKNPKFGVLGMNKRSKSAKNGFYA